MPIPRRHSLAGTCGIPVMGERVYVEVDAESDEAAIGEEGLRPVRIHWADGRSWKVERICGRREFGRRIFGNLCVRYEVVIRTRPKTLWHDKTGWFVRARRRAADVGRSR